MELPFHPNNTFAYATYLGKFMPLMFRQICRSAVTFNICPNCVNVKIKEVSKHLLVLQEGEELK